MPNWIYSTNQDNSARFLLGKQSDHMIIFIGINPSTAHPEKLDRTVSRCNNFAFTLGYGGWLMVNVYPQRATKPAAIHAKMDEFLHSENCSQIRKWVENREKIDVCAAWGVEIERRDYLKECLVDLATAIGKKAQWKCLSQPTKKGHPRHPLYLKSNAELNAFDINAYLTSAFE